MRPRLPAEWEPQAGAMLAWPHAGTDWAARLDRVEPVFLSIALAIVRHQHLLLLCPDETIAARLRLYLGGQGIDERRLFTAVVPFDDTWARDFGPLTVLQGAQPVLLDFDFNGWGGKYPAEHDHAVTRRLHDAGVFGKLHRRVPGMVLEGGSLDSDGEGTLLTTCRCLLDPTRNPTLDRHAIERRLAEHLGARRVLWLEHGALAGDDTDGHIDMLVRFGRRDTLLYQACDEPDYPFFDELQAMQAELHTLRTPQGRPYRLIPLPWPRPQYGENGERLPASYANFLPINHAVLVPVYGDPADAVAQRGIRACYPEREIIPIPCGELIRQHGSLHCLSMQFPAGVEFHAPRAG
ncbi:MAG TPA: agmatine deiminase family protein [Gammaproteobacteria bacterium]|nr:agmatine deiminase family protein [Gammaproteobacteria bacterium]